MKLNGEIFRRIRLYLGFDSRIVSQDICSESYLSLLETGKRTFDGEIAELLVTRLNALRFNGSNHGATHSEFSLEFELLRSYAASNKNLRAANFGQNLLTRIDEVTHVLAVDEARIRGTLSNSLLMLNRPDEAHAVLMNQLESEDIEIGIYQRWAWANYHEFLDESAKAAEDFERACHLAALSGADDLSNQLRQGAIHSRLECGDSLTSEDMSFLEKERDLAFLARNWSKYCLLSGSLALAHTVCNSPIEAERTLFEGFEKVNKIDKRVASTVYLVALNVLIRLDRREQGLRVLGEALNALTPTESTAAAAKMWRVLSGHAKALNQFEAATSCNRNREKILSQLAS